MNAASPPKPTRVIDHLRGLGLMVSAGLAATALYPFPHWTVPKTEQWWWLLGAFAVAVVSLIGVELPVDLGAARKPSTRTRRWLGLLVALAGTAAWLWATRAFYLDWYGHFDVAWLTWVGGTFLLALGLDLAAGEWGDRRSLRQTPLIAGALAVILVLAGWVRLTDIATFPGPDGMTQIEDLQFGNWGAHFLDGQRRRWEFIGHAWVSALGIKLGGPNLAAMRTAYAVVGTLTVGFVFLWLRRSAGWFAALAGTAFMIVSSWDAVVARIGFNPNVLTVAFIYWLMMGPGRRGRPSAYAFMGLACGYVLWEYIAYRPVVAFALAGGAFFSLFDREAPWSLRLGRPALMIALIVCMSIPLFGTRMKGRVMSEYLNGLNRARAEKSYYNEEHSWETTIGLRTEKAIRTVGLFFFEGDRATTRNVNRRPLVDVATAFFALLGFAYCVAHPLTPLFGMFAVAFVVTSIGAMIVTSDFNVLRMSVTIPYVYFFVGVGGYAVLRVWTLAWRAFGRWLAVAAVVAGVGWASWDNLSFLEEYHNAPEVRRAVRSRLARLCSWLGENIRPGEQVFGSAHREYNALVGSDAAWLRGGRIPGAMEWDIMSALERWDEDEPTVLVAYAGYDTHATARFLEDTFAGLDVHVIPDPLDLGAAIAVGRLPGRPQDYDAIMERLRCRGIEVRYDFVGEGKEVLRQVDRVQPLVGLSTWPSEVVNAFHQGIRPRRLQVTYTGRIWIEEAGNYSFEADVFGGPLHMLVDGERSNGRFLRRHLDRGEHSFRAVADLAPLGGGVKVRLLWRGPDSKDRLEPIPFYAMATPPTGCPAPGPTAD